MSVTENITMTVKKMKKGEPFTNEKLLKFGTRSSVDKAVSRLVERGLIERIARGVYVRPKKSRYVSKVMPDISRVVKTIAKHNGEKIQVHGAEAARIFKLTTQVPSKTVFYTSGSSREIKVGNLEVKLLHTTNTRKLQHAGEKVGIAISALWYLGKENINKEVISRVERGLSQKEFETLCNSKMPAWLSTAIETYTKRDKTVGC